MQVPTSDWPEYPLLQYLQGHLQPGATTSRVSVCMLQHGLLLSPHATITHAVSLQWGNLSQEQPTQRIERWTGHTFSLLPHNPSCWMESWDRDFLPCTLTTAGKLRCGASWKAEGYRVRPAVICVFRGKQNGILDEVGWGSQNEWCEEVHVDVVPGTAKSSVTERKRSHEVAFSDNVGCLCL